MKREIINNVSAYVDYDGSTAIVTVTRFDEDTGTMVQKFAKEFEKKGVKTETWLLDWRHGQSSFGAIHCLELPLIFGTWEQWKDAPFLEGVSRQEYEEKGAAFKQRLIEFVSAKLG